MRQSGVDLAGRDVVTLDTFSVEELESVIQRARRMKTSPPEPLLTGKVLAMVFFDPSLRTRASFAVAFSTLGGTVIDLVAARDLYPLDLREGVAMDGEADEHVRDAAMVLSSYADLIAIRALPRGLDWMQERRDLVIVSFQKHASVPIFNMESVLDHPCQAWGDGLTLREELGALEDRRLSLVWTWHPKPRPLAVPHGVATMAALYGMHLTVAHPPDYPLDPVVQSRLEQTARQAGGRVRFVHDSEAAFAGAEAVYAASWSSIPLSGRPAEEAARRQGLRHWRVTPEKMARTNNAHFLHAMPIRRNVEADDAVVDAPTSLVAAQAANRLHIQRALFCSVLGV